MVKLVCVLFFLAAAVCINANRIVGGDPTTIEAYPGIVQVEFRSILLWSQACAANILTTRYLLSAAHCFEGDSFNIRDRRIRAGTTRRSFGGTVVSISRAVNHPSYRGLSGPDGDISVIELASPLVYSEQIQPVTIVVQGFQMPADLPVWHVGWGATSEGGYSSLILQDVQIYTIDRDLCSSRFTGSIVTENMICAGILDVGGKDACYGDSGGPMYYDDILVGIVSWGRYCAGPFYPGVSTAVSSYTDWIVETAV